MDKNYTLTNNFRSLFLTTPTPWSQTHNSLFIHYKLTSVRRVQDVNTEWSKVLGYVTY